MMVKWGSFFFPCEKKKVIREKSNSKIITGSFFFFLQVCSGEIITGSEFLTGRIF